MIPPKKTRIVLAILAGEMAITEAQPTQVAATASRASRECRPGARRLSNIRDLMRRNAATKEAQTLPTGGLETGRRSWGNSSRNESWAIACIQDACPPTTTD